MRRLAILAVLLAACEKKEEDKPKKAEGPDRVKVRHILVSFQGAERSKSTLSFSEAEAKAKRLLERAKNGDDFERMMKKESEDPGPGVYWLVNTGIDPDNPQENPRENMVKGFGDAAFAMQVNEVRLVAYDPTTSPFGWHILQRME
jgi:parvulin-like peptidyl-prolyl isomerase